MQIAGILPTVESIQDQLKRYDMDQIRNLLRQSENPVALTYLSKSANNLVTIPIWTYFYGDKFFCFAGGKSKKVQAIKSGNTSVSLLIINRKFYPHPEPAFIPYLGIIGEARICTQLDTPKTAWIHQQLLLKYDPDLSQEWIRDLYHKIEANPEDDWLIEINPKKYYSS